MSEQELWETIFESFQIRLDVAESGVLLYWDADGRESRLFKHEPNWAGLFFVFKRYKRSLKEVGVIERDYEAHLAPYRILYV